MVYGSGGEEASGVMELTQSTFDSTISSNKHVLVMFYAPWCGHCKKLKPEFQSAAETLKGTVVFAQIDATAEKELANRHSIGGYPTLFLFSNGNKRDYTGGRVADQIVEWINKMIGSPIKFIGEGEMHAVVSKSLTFVARLENENTSEFKLFYEIADRHRDVGVFAVILGNGFTNKVVVYRRGESPIEREIGTDLEGLSNWVIDEQFPLFGPIDGDNYALYEGRPKELVWFCGQKSDFDKFGSMIRDTSAHFRDTHHFVWLDTEKFGSHAENALGVKITPSLVLKSKEGGRWVYPSNDNFDVANTKQFMKDVLSGKVEKTLKSEPIPEVDVGPVKTVVGLNFKEVVYQQKDIFLEIYAPWCGHCKKLEPEYNEFAEKVQKFNHLVVAKMDGTANEPPVADFQFKGFPTIFWMKAGDSVPTVYDGARTKRALLQWVKERSSQPIDVDFPSDEGIEAEEERDEL